MSKTVNFTVQDIKALEVLELEQAQAMGHALLDQSGTSKAPIKPEKVAYLHRSINDARCTIDVAYVFYNMLLKGEGLGSITSRYSKKFA